MIGQDIIGEICVGVAVIFFWSLLAIIAVSVASYPITCALFGAFGGGATMGAYLRLTTRNK